MLVLRCQDTAKVVALSGVLAVHMFCNRAANDRSNPAGNEPDSEGDRLRLGHAI